MARRFTKDLVAAFTAREHVPFLDEPIMTACLSFFRYLTKLSCLFSIGGAVMERKCRYHSRPDSPHMTEIEPFTGESVVWVDQNTSS